MTFGKAPFGESTYGYLGPPGVYGDSWVSQCAVSLSWSYVTPRGSTIVDDCGLRILPPPSVTDPAIPPAGSEWSGIRIPSVPYDAAYSVLSATLNLTANGNWSGYSVIRVYGVMQPDPPPFSPQNSVKGRPRTVTYTEWTAPIMSDGARYSVDVTEPTIELLAQPGRIEGMAIAYILVGVAGARSFLSTDPTVDIMGADAPLGIGFHSPIELADVSGDTRIFVENVSGQLEMGWMDADLIAPVAVAPSADGQAGVLARFINGWPGAGNGVTSLFIRDLNSSAQRDFTIV